MSRQSNSEYTDGPRVLTPREGLVAAVQWIGIHAHNDVLPAARAGLDAFDTLLAAAEIAYRAGRVVHGDGSQVCVVLHAALMKAKGIGGAEVKAAAPETARSVLRGTPAAARPEKIAGYISQSKAF